MITPRQRLQDALNVLDAAFAPLAERPLTVAGCTHCYGQADLDALVGPVDRVPQDLIPLVAAEALHDYPGTDPITSVLEAISVSTGTLAPWLDIWAEDQTEAADKHLRDAVHRWLLSGKLADLYLGFCDELHATPELLPWLLNTAEGRIGAAQFSEVQRIRNR